MNFKIHNNYEGCSRLSDYIIREQEIHKKGKVYLAYNELCDLHKNLSHTMYVKDSMNYYDSVLSIWGRNADIKYLNEKKRLGIQKAIIFINDEIENLYNYIERNESVLIPHK